MRPGSDAAALARLRDAGAEPVTVRYDDPPSLADACNGAACVVLAPNGLREAIVTAQSTLLDSAVAAGVPRFIASDYSLDSERSESA